ncbi:MAG: ribbon-helix-helix domain-containing protein [Proteobacteria bacterium]|nr:ribbon-helix-helix domain-containing protein [Pseudomonadota bacterium]
MSQITARLSEEMVKEIDRAARVLHRSRADIVRKAIETYLEDFDDLNTAIDRLRDPADCSLDWEQAKRELLAAD